MVSGTQGPTGAQGMALGGGAERGNRFRSCAGVSLGLTPENLWTSVCFFIKNADSQHLR